MIADALVDTLKLVPVLAAVYFLRADDGSLAHRATPSDRNAGQVNIVMADGHAVSMKPFELDARENSTGSPNNKWWNGVFDPSRR